MNEDQNRQEPVDFFSELMFGSARPTEAKEEPENIVIEEEKNVSSQEQQPLSQLEIIAQLVQTLGPYVSKLSPLLAKAQAFLNDKK